MGCCSISREEGQQKAPVLTTEEPNNEKNLKLHHQSGMILIEKGTFLMGSEDEDVNPRDQEGPVREVEVESFYIDSTPVTNLQFKEFIEDTGYVTDAQKYGWSFVFYLLLDKEQYLNESRHAAQTTWWRVIEGADWNHPEGPTSSIDERLDHPVVHVSWNDAMAYCQWSGKRLLTEKEWEFAARGGLVQAKYPWGNELTPNGKHMCNIWQGDFPYTNTAEDGYVGTSPVKTYPANDYGIYSISGNIWEWCSEDYKPSKGDDSKLTRGGSYLCHKSYCNRYRVAARTSNTIDSSTGNLGFRCGKSA